MFFTYMKYRKHEDHNQGYLYHHDKTLRSNMSQHHLGGTNTYKDEQMKENKEQI